VEAWSLAYLQNPISIRSKFSDAVPITPILVLLHHLSFTLSSSSFPEDLTTKISCVPCFWFTLHVPCVLPFLIPWPCYFSRENYETFTVFIFIFPSYFPLTLVKIFSPSLCSETSSITQSINPYICQSIYESIHYLLTMYL